MYGGVLYDATTGSGYRLNAYSLDDLGTVKWSTSAPSGWKTSYLAPCGTSLICASESRGSDYPSRIRLIDTSTGKTVKSYDAHNNHGAVPVGNRIMVSYQKNGSVVTDVLDHDGNLLHEWPGEAARLDDATALVASDDVFGLDDDYESPDASGYTVSGSGVQSFNQTSLGTVSEDLNACTWNDAYLVCSDNYTNSQFVIYKFRG